MSQDPGAEGIQVVTRIVRETRTPEQTVAAIPQLTNPPLNTRTIPDNLTDVEVDAPVLIQLAGEAKECSMQLAHCEADLAEQYWRILQESFRASRLLRQALGGKKRVGRLGIGVVIRRVL